MEPQLNEENCLKENGDGRRVWESSNFSVTKVILEEGDSSVDRPRFGSVCTVKAENVSCSGEISVERLKSELSKYLGAEEWVLGGAESEVDR